MTGVFIGIDLAWDVDRRHTGVAVMEGDSRAVRLTDVASGIRSFEALTQLIRAHLGPCMMVAVDASLIVRNDSGQRPCETAVGRAFGRHGASCHSSNRTRPHFDSGGRLVRSLAQDGFRHALPLTAAQQSTGRWIVEVYPHPAMIRLFYLERILPYTRRGPSPGAAPVSAACRRTCGSSPGAAAALRPPRPGAAAAGEARRARGTGAEGA